MRQVLWLLAVVMLLLSGCQPDAATPATQNGHPDGQEPSVVFAVSPIRSSRQLAGLTRGERFVGDSVPGETAYTLMPTSETFHISGYWYRPSQGETVSSLSGPNFFVNEAVRYDSEEKAWRVSGPYHVPAPTDKTDFYAWFTPQGTEGVTLPDDQAGGMKLRYQVSADVGKHPDLLAALTTGYVYDDDNPPEVPVTFHHQLTEVNFIMGNWLSPGTVTEIAFENVCTDGTLAVGTTNTAGVWTQNTVGTIAFPVNFATRKGEDHEKCTGDTILKGVMMIPQKFTSNTQRIRIKIMLHNVEEHTVYGVLREHGREWLPGHAYTYEVSSTNLRQDVVIDIPEVTPKDFGKVIGKDGRVYENNYRCWQSTGVDGVAMIAYVGENKGDADNETDENGNPKWRGLAIARTSVPLTSSGVGSFWSTEKKFSCPYFSERDFTKIWDASTGKFGDLNGLRSTKLLANKWCIKQATEAHTHEAAEAAMNYIAPSWPSFDPMVFGMSEWFLPTASQWLMFFQACGVPIEYLTKAGWFPGEGGDTSKEARVKNKEIVQYTFYNVVLTGLDIDIYHFWSSSEYTSEYAWGIWVHETEGLLITSGLMKDQDCHVRPFLAF